MANSAVFVRQGEVEVGCDLRCGRDGSGGEGVGILVVVGCDEGGESASAGNRPPSLSSSKFSRMTDTLGVGLD